MRPIYALILAFPILLTGQERPAPEPKTANSSASVTQDALAAMEKQIAELKKQVETLNKVAEEYKTRFPWYEDIAAERKEVSELSELLPRSVVLAPSKRGFDAITSKQGTIFYVSLEQVESFLDGYKIILKIGNPYAADFTDPKITLDWNKRVPDSIPDFQKWQAEWKKEMRSEEFTNLTDLRAGAWTHIPVVLARTRADELGWLVVRKLSVSGVALTK
jgi:hypothetical protein